MTGNPTISVVLVAYQHGKYLSGAIESVLNQTFTDFELIIIDDGSTDNSDAVIRTFNDPRLRYLPQKNQGPSVATNNGILAARGKYIALLCGDDEWYPHRLQTHYDALSDGRHALAVSWIDIIDESGLLITSPHPARDLWDLPQLSRREILRRNFFNGPCLNGITAMVERQLFLDAGLYHLTSIQAQDFEMFARLAMHYDVLAVPVRLVKYRLRDNDQNLHRRSVNREEFELLQIYREMLDNAPIDLFREAFGPELVRPDFSPGVEHEIEKALLYLKHRCHLFASLGNEKLFHLLRKPENLQIATEKYGIDLPRLYELNQAVDIGGRLPYRELHKWVEELTTAKEWLVSQIAYKDQAIAQHSHEIARLSEKIARFRGLPWVRWGLGVPDSILKRFRDGFRIFG